MINEELGAKVLSAAKASRALALDYAATDNWMPRERLPKLETYRGGWPSFSSPVIGSDDGPRKLNDLFGLKRDRLVPFAYSDVPELVELFNYVQDHPDIADLFQLRMPDGSLNARQDLREVMTHIGATGLATSVMARADALGIGSDAELIQLYEEREAALLASSLVAELVVPLTVVDIEFEERLPVSEHVWIERMRDKMQIARAPVDSSIYAVPSPLAGAAVLAVVVKGLTLENSPHWKRQTRTDFDGLPLDVVEDVCTALRILIDAQIGYSQVLIRPVGWADHWTHDLPAVEEVGRVRRYSSALDHFGWLSKRALIPAKELDDLPGVFARLRSAPPRVKLAAKRLSESAMEPDEPDSAVDACIGIEALVGEEHDELVHRMALRAATALAPSSNPQVIYKAVKSAYDYRSAIVHGTKPSKKKQKVPLPSGGTVSARTLARVLLRALLRSVLAADGGWTPATLDARLLASLDRSALGETAAADE
jgi:Apea-like HEPN